MKGRRVLVTKRSKFGAAALGVGLLAAFVPLSFARSAAQSFVVTTKADSGAGSLRQAIEDANNNGNPGDTDLITFNIGPENEVHTISVKGELPAITQPVTINGYSQPGAKENTKESPEPLDTVLKIEITGENATNSNGLQFKAGGTLRGVAINRFANAVLVSAPNVKLYGNFLHASVDGKSNPSTITTGYGVQSDRSCASLQVGGENPAMRNIILSPKAAGSTAGLNLDCSGTTIEGNYIGVGVDGETTTLGQAGIIVGSQYIQTDTRTNVRIGGSSRSKRNVISGAEGSQIILFSEGNRIQGNYIGTDYTGKPNAKISNGNGITLQADAKENRIGGTESGDGNIIAGVHGSGVLMIDYVSTAKGISLAPGNVSVIGNSIYAIGAAKFYDKETGGLAIDMVQITDTSSPLDYIPESNKDLGPNKNDSGDGDGGANGNLNSPDIKSAVYANGKLTISYNLDAKGSPSNQYRVEFFANDTQAGYPYGPGQTLVGAQNGVEPGKNKSITLTLGEDMLYKQISATTTVMGKGLGGYGSTSEFAKNVVVSPAIDKDGDGVPDAIEAAAPNDGDGNNDTKPDSEQSNVTSLPNEAGTYVSVLVEGCERLTKVKFLGQNEIVDGAAFGVKDEGFVYPFGFIDFTLSCSYKASAQISLWAYSDFPASKFVARKYNATGSRYASLPDQDVTQENVANRSVIKLSYDITDGGDFDDDGSANGVIVDPIGIASEDSSLTSKVSPDALTATGIAIIFIIFSVTGLIFATFFSYHDYLVYRAPLRAENPNLKYTYLHYVAVVSWPQLKYRVSNSFSRAPLLKRLLGKK